MDLPIQNGGSFHSYVKLPEGMFKLDQDALIHCCQRAAGPGHGASIVAVGLCVFLPVRQLSGCRWTTGVNNRTGCYGCWLLVVRVKVS